MVTRNKSPKAKGFLTYDEIMKAIPADLNVMLIAEKVVINLGKGKMKPKKRSVKK